MSQIRHFKNLNSLLRWETENKQLSFSTEYMYISPYDFHVHFPPSNCGVYVSQVKPVQGKVH